MVESKPMDENWAITDEVRRVAASAKIEIEKATRSIEKMTPVCPTHQKRGQFVKYVGAYTTVKGLFKCPEGHDFFMS